MAPGVDGPAGSAGLIRSIVLVTSPTSRQSQGRMDGARAALARNELTVVEDVDVRDMARVRRWVDKADGERPLIVAAGGDGTVGAVVGAVAGTGAVMGILPLGTSNDVARSLGVPPRSGAAARLLADGKIASVDVGRFEATAQPDRFFVHAAAMGLDVEFARLATQPALRHPSGASHVCRRGLPGGASPPTIPL